MITYSSILAGVAGYMEMDETDTELSSKFDILNKANDAQNTIAKLAPLTFVDELIKSVTGNLQQDVPYYQWPDDFVRFSNLYVDYSAEITDSNQGDEAFQAPDNSFQVRSLDMRPQTIYPMYAIVGGGFELRPTPDADQVDGFMLRYVYQLPDMVTTEPTQDCILRAALKTPLIYLTVSLICSIDNYNLEKSKKFSDLFDREMSSLWGSNIDYQKQKEKAGL